MTHETIYQSLYVQAKGSLRREVATWSRTGRVHRRPHRKPDERQSWMATPMIMISERPAEVEDRAVPGHWEGDLIIGRHHGSAIGTLVERATRFVMLLHLPNGYTPAVVRDALATKITTLPASYAGHSPGIKALRCIFTASSPTPPEPVYFCDPHSPWQRGTSENTNGLLRQYFPTGTDLTVHTAEHLDHVEAELNDDPA